MAQLLPDVVFRLLDGSARPVSGGTATFYLSGTSTSTPIYSDSGLRTALPNPISTNSSGLFINGSNSATAIYIDPSISYRAVFKDADGTVIRDIDPVFSGLTSPTAPYGTRAELAELSIAADQLTVNTTGYSTAGIGGAEYVRTSYATIVAGGYPAASYFRSLDRYMPDGSTNTVNGGYWLLAGSMVAPSQLGALLGGDDTDAVNTAFAFANRFKRTGATAAIFHPGGTVVLESGVYTLSTLAEEIPVECNVEDQGARFIVPTAYAGKAIRVGMNTAGDVLSGAQISLPEITRATSTATAGSIGVSLENIYSSSITMQRIEWFDTPRACRSYGFGCAYNTIYAGQSASGNKMFDITPLAGGWFNSNRVIGSNWFMPGVRVAGNYFINLDGSVAASEITGNVFIGIAMEGRGAQYAVKGKDAIGNTFIDPYMETGEPAVAVTVSGDTLTSVAHGLSVGDPLSFAAAVLPTGMYDSQTYYVVSVPTADTFTVSLDRTGAAITFGSSGTTVVWYVGMICYWDGTGAATRDNSFINRSSPYITPVIHVQVGQALRNGEDSTVLRFSEVYSPSDIPAFRARNTFNSTSITRVMYAGYEPTVDPQANPELWRMGLGDRGLWGKNTDYTLAGRISIATGRINFQSYVAGVGTTRTVPSVYRGLGTVETMGSCIIPANSQFVYTHAISGSGIASGDFPTIGWVNDLSADTGMMWVRVSTTDTLKFCFRNFTAAPIDLAGKQFTVCVASQYY